MNELLVKRERAVYDVDCRVFLIDLIGNECGLTQAFRRIALQLRLMRPTIAPYARYLIYKFDPSANTVTVERTQGKVLMKINY